MNMLTEKSPTLVLEGGKPVACEDCCPCDVYYEAGFEDSDVIWRRCSECRQKEDEFIFNFWQEKIEWKRNGDVMNDNRKVARINGYHYVLGYANRRSYRLGSGGRKYVIKFISGPHAGETVTCTDVWHQGEIHESFIDDLPDNAVFVNQY